jgi:multiple sugar transport system permease protein
MKKFFDKVASNETVAGYVFLLPNFLGFLAFTLIPVFASLGLSFVDWDLFSPPKFVGFANFVNLLGFHREAGALIANDANFWTYLYNTVYMMLGIPFCIAGSLILALAINQKLKGIVFFRTILFLPTVCSGVALLILWKWVYNPDYGMLNAVLSQIFSVLHLNIRPPEWLLDPMWAKPALIIMGVWGAVGGTSMILYLAALQGVPRELYEAAEIDGANNWRKFWAVTVPFISPTTFFVTITSIIGGFQGGFMAAYIMTNGGPAGSTTTLDFYIYQNAYTWFKMGYAASISWFLFIVIFIVTLINWRFGGKLVHY